MATATASANIEVSASLIQSESRVQQTFTESSQMVTSSGTEHRLKKKKSSRRHKDEGTVSVSKSSEKLHKKLKASSAESSPACVRCARAVFAMERVKAERRVWHKECFRCHVCDKQLTVETYQSDQHTLYCRQHFKQLFEPKPVDEEDQTDAPPKKHQMIICESNPVELPPDVVRASDKPDLGLSSLSALDVRARFQLFEQPAAPPPPPPPAARPHREKSSQLLSKLAKFKAKGMDVGVSDEYLNGVTVEPSSSEPEDEDDADSVLRKSYLHSSTEAPLAVKNMSELVGKFETQHDELSERHRSRKQEIQNIRSRLFLGKQQKIKEMYEESVKQSEQSITSSDKIARELEVDSEKSRAIKQRFESGEVFNDENQPPKTREYEDTTLFNEGIGKKSRSIFLELDANAKSAGPLSPPAPADVPKRKEIPFVPRDLVRSEDRPAEVQVQTADISDRFRFFETYKPETQKKEFRMTPPRQTQRANSPSPEPYVEPTVARAGAVGDTEPASERHTASRMIHVFREMETNQYRDKDDQGPKPLKRFTPPPPGACRGDSSSESGSGSGSEDEDSEEEQLRVMQEQRMRDDALRQAQSLARTTSFRGRFENYREPERPAPNAPVIERDQQDDDDESQLETAKSLRAKFENMNVSQSVNKSQAPRVNRFV